MRKYNFFISVLVCSGMILTACNNNDLKSTDPNTKSKETANSEMNQNKDKSIPVAAKDFEGIMQQNPGKFSGENYDKTKVEQELDKLPNNLNADQAYNHLVYLLGENYQKYYRQILAFDPTIQVSNKTPDGKIQTPTIEKLNVEIVLDASGSMNGKVNGKQKMALAKQAIQNFASNLPEEANVSLRVYGHKGSNSEKDKAVSCQSNEIVYPLSTYNASNFQVALDRFKPTGWTPLASAIQAAKNDLQQLQQENTRNVVYVVSDGIETCGGDPVKEAEELNKLGIKPVVNVVGFDVDNPGQKQLKAVAEAAGGSYKSVYSENDLKEFLEAEKERLRNEWDLWGSRSSLEAWKDWAKNQQKLDQLIYDNGINGLNKKEFSNMQSAVEYLKKKGKLKEKVFMDLDQMIRDRNLLIENGALQLQSSMSEKIREAERNAYKEIEHKKQEGLNSNQ